MENSKINKLSVTFTAKDRETAYREASLRHENIQAIIGILILVFPAILFLYSDFLLYGLNSSFYKLAAARLFYLIFSVSSIIILAGTKKPLVADIVVFLFLCTLIGLVAYVNLSRPPKYIFFVFIDIVILLSMYFLFSNRLFFQIIPALTFTIFDLIFIINLKIDLNQMAINVIIISYLFSNIIGIFSSHRLQKSQRETFSALQREKRLKEESLELANNIKTLRGLLPICSRCKKIRDSKGYWERLEQYVEDNTEASFSHSLCDECAKELYGHEEWYKKMQDK